MASLPYPRTPLSPRLHPSFPTLAPLFLPLHALLFPRLPHLFSSSYSLLLSSASTDADARIDRRRHPHRPTRMLVTFVDVSQCQTFTFVLPNRCFCSSKPPFPYLTPSFSFHIFPRFSQSAVLSCCVHPLVAVLKTVSLAYNNIMCASTMRCFNCKQLLKRA